MTVGPDEPTEVDEPEVEPEAPDSAPSEDAESGSE